MTEVKWQLQFKYYHPLGDMRLAGRARPHAYLINAKNFDKSLCGKHTYNEDTEDINEGVLPTSMYYLKPNKETFCNKCLKILEKLNKEKEEGGVK